MDNKAFNSNKNKKGTTEDNIMMLFNLYWPGLRQGFFLYALYPFLAFIVVAMAHKYVGKSLEWLLDCLFLLVCSGPMMLTKNDYKDVSNQLPVNALEKLSFLLICFWIIAPLVLCGSFFLGKFVSEALFGYHLPVGFFDLQEIVEIFGSKALTVLGVFIAIGCIVSVELYYVVKAKDNRGQAGWISFTILLFAFFIVCLILDKIDSHSTVLGISEAGFQILSIWVLFTICATILCLYIVKLYKLLRHSGF